MLPSAHRMRHGSDFSAAVRKGRRAGRPTLVIHLNRTGSDPASPARVGFVVSKAVGPAVVRNRVKRQLRHITRDRLAALPSGSLVVVRANPAAAGSSTLADDFDNALAAALRASSGGGPERRRGPDRVSPTAGNDRG
ncbi:ribonuclease P protein component [Kineosporia sp. NBRC 101731]|uniref:ribonuclease P protein component n=1 Tax=Kineosporia sp. NBRC 101731 TaxID=3032199 RepID=UPI002555E46F|nr:ribonuclease P protein component [Kineosporia sp. NBRC 101731]